jgi:hypothetical protein
MCGDRSASSAVADDQGVLERLAFDKGEPPTCFSAACRKRSRDTRPADTRTPGHANPDMRRRLSAMSSRSGGGAAFGAVLVLLRGELVAVMLPRVRERGERCSRPVGIRCRVVVEDLVDVAGHDGREHVQHLVTLIAGSEQPLRGVPDLGRVVGPELVRDDFVHRQVVRWPDGCALEVNLVAIVGYSRAQFGMLSKNQDASVVFVVGVEERQVDAVELTGRRRNCETAPLVFGHVRTLPTRAAARPTTRQPRTSISQRPHWNIQR